MRSTGAVVLGGVFAILIGTYACVWQSRDWNVSSRLMLVYALGDRGTVRINGLEDHTRDRARIGRDYYSDKFPGTAIVGVPVYLLCKTILGLPAHPLDAKGDGFTHWPADYWVTLGVSGLATALAAVLLAGMALDLGAGARLAVGVGLAYGLATPACVYATLFYGHALTSLLALVSLVLIWQGPRRHPRVRALLAGMAASGAATVELQVAPVSAVLGVYLVSEVIRGRWPRKALGAFAVGAAGPLLLLLLYNQLAFGSPFDAGYFHEDLRAFSDVHSEENPLGLKRPAWERAGPLLWGSYRGLLFYATVVVLAIPGWARLARAREWGLLGATLAACLAVFLVNLSYPEWTGGWSTGPRLLLPLLPFAMVAVGAAVARGGRLEAAALVLLSLWGAGLMFLFLGAGGRVPHTIAHPLTDFVWPLWKGAGELARCLGAGGPGWTHVGPRGTAWRAFMPLAVGQIVATCALLLGVGKLERRARGVRPPDGSTGRNPDGSGPPSRPAPPSAPPCNPGDRMS